LAMSCSSAKGFGMENLILPESGPIGHQRPRMHTE